MKYLVLLILITPFALSAKLRFDVKSGWMEKYNASAVKAGLITALENSSWAEVAETDEEYSLWIKSFIKERRGDTIFIRAGLEIQEPAALLESKHYRRVRLRDTLLLDTVPAITGDTTEMLKQVRSRLDKNADFNKVWLEIAKFFFNKVPVAGEKALDEILAQFGMKRDNSYTAEDALMGLYAGVRLSEKLRQEIILMESLE